MTDTIVYHNSNGATISMATENLTVKYDFGNKTVYQKSNKASITHDPNRVRRIFEWACLLTRANFDTLDGYVRPAAAPTYDATYPKIAWQKDGSTSENVIGMITGCNVSQQAQNMYWVSITFTERYS